MDAAIFISVGLVLYLFGDKIIAKVDSGNPINEVAEDNKRQTALNDTYYKDENAFMLVANNLRKMLE